MCKYNKEIVTERFNFMTILLVSVATESFGPLIHNRQREGLCSCGRVVRDFPKISARTPSFPPLAPAARTRDVTALIKEASEHEHIQQIQHRVLLYSKGKCPG